MKIGLSTIDDIPQMCDLLALLFDQEAEFRPHRKLQAEGLRQIMDFPERGEILVLREGTSIIGMVNILYTISTALGGKVAILEDMVVVPAKRGRGAGSRLLNEAIALAKGRGCLRITLLTDRDNESAQRFYETHGFNVSAMIPMRLLITP